MTLQEQFVTYPIAKAMKEMGFDEECFAYFSPDHKGATLTILPENFNSNEGWRSAKGVCSAPLWQQCEAWLTRMHGIIVQPWLSMDNTNTAIYTLEIPSDRSIDVRQVTRDAAILHALSLVQLAKEPTV
jgi:hypothetical protein